jgi:hypothetical protein
MNIENLTYVKQYDTLVSFNMGEFISLMHVARDCLISEFGFIRNRS